MPIPEMSWSVPWQEADGFEALASFASGDCLPAAYRGASTEREIYKRLLDAKWSYVTEPWNPGQGQFVRDPDTILAERSATCLDIAVMFCAMALEAGKRPQLAILESSSRTRDRHAVVLLSEETPIDTVRSWTQGDFAAADDFTVVDVVQALNGKSWDVATVRGRGHFSSDTYTSCYVVDVKAAQEEGNTPLAPLPIDSPQRPSIYQMLPPQIPLDLLPWQATVPTLADLQGGGYVVVAGESGKGKSAAVLPAAHQVAHGSGWLLPAKDANALLTSYAAAAASGRPRIGEAVKAAAPLALQRLHESHAPWVVVIDGADHPDGPEHYRNLLPTPANGQVVYITTTQTEKWRHWRPDAEFVLAAPEEVSPLILGMGGVAGQDVTECVSARLDELSGHTKDFARTLAWLPAIPSAVPAGMAVDAADAIVSELIEAGFVNAATRLMHNLVREALQQSEVPNARLLEAFIVAYPMQFAADDSERLDQMLARLDDGPDRQGVELVLADARTRDHAQWAARYYGMVLSRLGCMHSDGSVVADWQPEDADQARLARRCLEGVARWRFRDRVGYQGAKDLVDKGLELADIDVDPMRDSKLRALELNARRSTITRNPDLSREQQYQALEEILAELRAVYEFRKDWPEASDADVYRALFNLGGPKLLLGKLAAVLPNPSRTPTQWFESANQDYAGVYGWRHGYFGTDDIEDVATCLNGQASTTYFQAISDVTGTPGSRARLLGDAANMCARALASRLIVAWADGGVSNEVRGSAKMLTKIAGAQQELCRAKGEPWEPLTTTVTETIQDWELFSE